MTTRSRRFAWRVVLLAAILLALAAWGGVAAVQAWQTRQVGGRLRAAAPDSQLNAGSFVIQWHAGRRQLQIRHDADPERVLWESLPGRAFVAAGTGAETVHTRLAHFKVAEQRLGSCTEQSVDALTQRGEAVVLTGTLACGPAAVGYEMVFSAESPHHLHLALTLSDPALNRLYLTYASTRDEHFYGFGEQFSAVDCKGRRLPILVNEQGIGRGLQPLTIAAELQQGVGGAWHTTYAAVPHYLTSRLRSLALDNADYVIFDLRRADRVQIQLFSPTLDANIYYGATPADLIAAHTAHVGRMRTLPDWILDGVVVGLQGGTAVVRERYARLQAADVPVAGLWLQDWVGQRTTDFGDRLWWNWQLDARRYPNWDQLVADLAADGVGVLVYINPHVTDVAANPSHTRNLLREAADNGYLVRRPDGADYLFDMGQFEVGMVDLTNPAAWAWYQAVIIDELIAQGVKGWMADFGEALPPDAVLADGSGGMAAHNRYPEQWAALNRAAVDAVPGGDDLVFFQRAAYTGSPGAATLFWTGDQLVTWDRHDGIKSAVTGMLSSGFSGFALQHSDTGGYTALNSAPFVYRRDPELLLRWMELSAFSTVFRTHEGNRPAENAQVYSDDESLAHLRRMGLVYQAWGFYRRELVDEAAATGLPVLRHLFIHYPDDSGVYDLTYEQFLVGSELLVAPVLDPGRKTVNVYLPAGEWVHVWSGERFGRTDHPTTVTVNAPLGQPGVFYRVGSPVGAQFVANLVALGVLDAAPPVAAP